MDEGDCSDLAWPAEKSGRYLEIDGAKRQQNAVFPVRGDGKFVVFHGHTHKNGVWGKLKRLVIRMVPEIICSLTDL